MSETAKRYALLEEETTRFVQDLVARAVEPPIERFRESAEKALEGPGARLVETRETVVQATGELASRIGSKLDSLQDVLDEALEGVPHRQDLERLRKQVEEQQRLTEGVLNALAQLSTTTTSGLEALALHTGRIEAASRTVQSAVGTGLPQRLDQGFGALEAKLAANRELTSLQARLEQVDSRLRSSLDEITRQLSSLRELETRPAEEAPDRISPALTRLETGLALLAQRSQASLEHFHLLATQVRDLRGEVAAVRSQVQALPAGTEILRLPEIQAVEERLTQQVQAEGGRLRRAMLWSWALLFLLLILVLLVNLGRG